VHGAEDETTEGWEGLEDEASSGALAPSAELEEALREAAEAVEARHAGRDGASPSADSAAPADDLDKAQDRYIRLQADFENHRRRALKEREEAFRYGHEKLARDLLAVLDDLERAIEHANASETKDFDAMLQGVMLVHRELIEALEKHGVTEIDADGKPFDPNVHEAMAQHEDESLPPNTVIQAFQKGYSLRDRLLRPARVLVSKVPGGSADEDSGGGS
jgi:molecular chaperone GrpE